ncbi:MAG: carbamoyl-phosphate synthase large subunit [Candidatus Vidania fulgoroideorum]
MKKTNKKIIVLGSGPIIIGQACEFDYSGVQACKILKKEGYKVILLNNNPSTIMTDKSINYKNYLENININNLKKIIIKEKTNKVFPIVGGQTALNIILKTIKKKNININIIGPSIKSILNSENRNKFRKIMKKNNIPISISYSSKNIKDAIKKRKKLIIKSKNKEISIRPSYTLGGLGGGIVKNKKKFIEIFKKALIISKNSQVLLEESLYGYKELELEILIDKKKNFIVVCAIENLDPVGIHTGDSICFSPIQTLTDKEYQLIRDTSKKAINKIGLKSCGANIQIAINKNNGIIKIIEVNPRLSRSSAFASKATGYPIAKIATKLSLGYKLNRIKNYIVKKTSSFFEPSIDYIVTKIPKFSSEKFNEKISIINNQMKSTGEVMSIHENIESSLKNSINEIGNTYLTNNKNYKKKNIYKKNFFPNNKRINYIFNYINFGKKIKKLSNITKIDTFLLNKISKISKNTNIIKKINIFKKRNTFIYIKKNGFSDIEIANLLALKEYKVIAFRLINKIIPKYKKVDSCACEFKTNINYFYENYSGKCEMKSNKKQIIVLGSGPNKIGQGIEFDYCCVHSAQFLKKNKIKSIIINCNPETVSTDYDISNKLYFLPTDFENIINVYIKEKTKGIIIQFCGQIKNKLIKLIKIFNKKNIKNKKNKKYKKIKIYGTKIENISLTEKRKEFNKFLTKNNIRCPKSFTIFKNKKYKKIKFPIILRPSYVLGGENMKIIKNNKKLNKFINKNKKFPILIEEFFFNNFEFDVDFICDKKNSILLPIMQQIEKTGIHSGDSICFSPSRLNKTNKINILKICSIFAKKFNIVGFANVQIAYNKLQKNIKIIEVNLRASRTIPIIMKIMGKNIIYKTMKIIIFKKKIKRNYLTNISKNKIFIKKPIFSFIKYLKSDILLNAEMKSTGENLNINSNFYNTFIKTINKIDKIFIINKKIRKFKKYINKINKKIYLFKLKTKNQINKKEINKIIKKIINLKIEKKSIIFINKSKKIKKIRIFLKNIGINIITNNRIFILLLKCIIKNNKKTKIQHL